MRFHQLGVLPPSNDYVNPSINANSSESRSLISSNQLKRKNSGRNGNDYPNVTDNLNLTQLKSIVSEKRAEGINDFNSTLDGNKTTALDILKFQSDSKYFKSYLDSQTDANNIDSTNGNNGVILIETLNFIEDNLSEVRLRQMRLTLNYPKALEASQKLRPNYVTFFMNSSPSISEKIQFIFIAVPSEWPREFSRRFSGVKNLLEILLQTFLSSGSSPQFVCGRRKEFN